MHAPLWLIDLLIFLAAGVLIVPLFSALRISSVLAYLLAGLLVGRGGFALIPDAESAAGLAEMGIVFLLFTIGLELSFERLKRLATLVFGLGLIQVVLTAVLITGAALALGQSGPAAIALGMALALSSTAFVLQLLAERGERSTRAGQTGFAILLFQDLAIVPMLIIVPVLASTGGSLAGALATAMVQAVLAVVAVMLVGRYGLRPAFRWIVSHGGSEVFVGATLLVVLGLAYLMSLAGLSLALGAFLAGLLLAETEYRHQIEADVRPFRGVLLGLFFMTVGMRIAPDLIWDNLGDVLLITAGLLALKSSFIAVLCRTFGLPWRHALQTGLLLSQGGEFAFVLLGQAVGLNLLGDAVSQVVYAAIILSMIATPLLAALGAWVSSRETAAYSVPTLKDQADDLADHIIIIGFGRVGRAVAKIISGLGLNYIALDTDHRQVRISRDKGACVFYGEAANSSVIKAAGGHRALAAVVTIDKAATAVAAVETLREAFPDLTVIVRSRDDSHSEQLLKAGAHHVVPDTLEASLQLGSFVLKSSEIDDDQIGALLATFRQNDYADLKDRDGVASQSR